MGKAASTDVMDATARAYLNAVNKALFAKSHGLVEEKTSRKERCINPPWQPPFRLPEQKRNSGYLSQRRDEWVRQCFKKSGIPMQSPKAMG